MRITAPLLTLAGTVAGTAAAVVAYQSAASVGSSGTEPASVKTDNPTSVTTTTWLPCERGWKVAGKACVRVKHKVVVVHDLPAPAAAPAGSVGVRSSSGPGSSGDDQGEDTSGGSDDGGAQDQAEDESGDDTGSSTEGGSHEDVGGDD